MTRKIPVSMGDTWIYDIVMESSFDGLVKELTTFDLKSRRVCVVTDSNVASLYLEEVKSKAEACFLGAETFVFPAGEENKNLDTVKKLYEFLIQKQFDRNDYLIALGGGVVGDLCGFAAATYLRGISFIQIPTTLLSQVDSSIGGKTGVDFDSYKNMVGAFHMPRLVYINTETLKTLSEAQYSSGMGEIIKHGLIKSKTYYEWIAANGNRIMARDGQACSEMIAFSDEIKGNIVKNDPTEKGERALLNFGHTLGHALEKVANFTLLHGHCVGLGCLAASRISAARGAVTMEEVDSIRSLMENYGMPVRVSGVDGAEIIKTTKADKKMDSGVIKFILLKELGTAYVDRTVTEEEMALGLSYILDREKK